MGKELRTHKLIGTAREVHTIIGTGHLEVVYHESLEIGFKNRKIPLYQNRNLLFITKREN